MGTKVKDLKKELDQKTKALSKSQENYFGARQRVEELSSQMSLLVSYIRVEKSGYE